ncbi:MAG: hypothetical protein ACJ72A_10955, partial [Nocardioidaceae bacterium]
ATGPVHVNLARGRATGQGRDRLVNIRCVVGSRFDDVLIGTSRNDGIDAGGGLNLMRAGAGNDEVTGGARADEVHLGPGAARGAANLVGIGCAGVPARTKSWAGLTATTSTAAPATTTCTPAGVASALGTHRPGQ